MQYAIRSGNTRGAFTIDQYGMALEFQVLALVASVLFPKQLEPFYWWAISKRLKLWNRLRSNNNSNNSCFPKQNKGFLKAIRNLSDQSKKWSDSVFFSFCLLLFLKFENAHVLNSLRIETFIMVSSGENGRMWNNYKRWSVWIVTPWLWFRPQINYSVLRKGLFVS